MGQLGSTLRRGAAEDGHVRLEHDPRRGEAGLAVGLDPQLETAPVSTLAPIKSDILVSSFAFFTNATCTATSRPKSYGDNYAVVGLNILETVCP
jgi:hypothetical protein